MTAPRTALRRSAALAGALALAFTGTTAPAYAALPGSERAGYCHEPSGGAAGARGEFGPDHRDVSAAEQRAIEKRTDRILRRKGNPAQGQSIQIPVYVHEMQDKKGGGDVTKAQIADQIDVLNETFAGQEDGPAPDTGFTFYLAGADTHTDNAWHGDHQSTTYRAETRQGGADALNIWLVDFKYLGIATFPWDYEANPAVDGVRVNYRSLPGGPLGTNYSLGKTATHEVGHWLGLYHTFQGGCTELNDEVGDTPAQSSPTGGCPEGRDSCTLPGLDPIHNYMDYSFDSCYDRFSKGQDERMHRMWTAYRA